MPGMQVPEPGGSMKKMSFEFADPAQAAAAQEAMPQGILPSGAQGQAPPDQGMQPDPSQGFLGSLANQGGGFGGGMDSGMIPDAALSGMVDQDPDELAGGQMSDFLLDPSTPPQMAQPVQMQLMEAAKRRLGS